MFQAIKFYLIVSQQIKVIVKGGINTKKILDATCKCPTFKIFLKNKTLLITRLKFGQQS
jgi:hypothetical protein